MEYNPDTWPKAMDRSRRASACNAVHAISPLNLVYFSRVTDQSGRLVNRLCDLLSKAVAADKANGWDNEHKNVYQLAELIMTRTMSTFMSLRK
jgi:hypothetical protein